MTVTSEEIQANRIRLRALERSAEQLVGVGQYENALRVIAGGADWAWFNHTGLFASPLFENLLTTIGTRLLGAVPAVPVENRTRTVLHVLTQAYPTGGHSRLAWRWMSLDRSSRHSVILTNQYQLEVPQDLVDACEGRITSLTGTSLVDKVRELAPRLMEFDVVVLHIHPFDTVAVAACAGTAGRPRTLLVNHADHVFWLGLSAADQLVNLRPASEWIASDRRTGSSDRFVRLPIPLDEPTVAADAGPGVRRSLGIESDEPLLATVAEPYKFASSDGLSFTALISDLFRRLPSAHLVAVGPSPSSSDWTNLGREFPTRVHLLGRTPEYSAILSAANVYLDSFPFSSITSMLEAALHGVPVVTTSDPSRGPLNFDDFKLAPASISTAAEWLTLVDEWCRTPELARSVGSDMQQVVRSVHGRSAWIEQVDALYALPWTRDASPVTGGSTELTSYDDAIQDLHRAGELTRTFDELMLVSGVRLMSEPDGELVSA